MEKNKKTIAIIAGVLISILIACGALIAIGFGSYKFIKEYVGQSSDQASEFTFPDIIDLNPEKNPIENEDGRKNPGGQIEDPGQLIQDTDLGKLFSPFWLTRELLHDNFLEQPIDDQLLSDGAILGLEQFLETNGTSLSEVILPEGAPTPEEIANLADTPSDMIETFLPFWEAWIKLAYIEIPEGTTEISLMRQALSGMVEALDDPYTNYFDPDLAKRWEGDLSGEYEGIGAWVDVDAEYLTIISPIKDTPAEAAGLQPGDQIIAIDGDDMTGVDPNIALTRVLGDAGTKVILTILREETVEPFDVEIIRKKISIPYIESEILDNNIAYLKLLRFYEGADVDIRNALEDLFEQNPTGLIFDLRGNPGGYLHTVVSITSEFIADGNVLIEEFNDGSTKNYPTRNNKGIATEIPLVVLIDQGSASASEIFAGAVHDYERGILVGQTSFGKGLVQLPVTLPDEQGIVSISIARWLTPSGSSIHEIGIEPDISIDISETDIEQDLDPQLEKAIELLTSN